MPRLDRVYMEERENEASRLQVEFECESDKGFEILIFELVSRYGVRACGVRTACLHGLGR